jgi:hypothetical protein
MGGDDPNAVREFRYFQSLTPEQQQQYLNVKRQNLTVIGDTIYNKASGEAATNVGGAIERGELCVFQR